MQALDEMLRNDPLYMIRTLLGRKKTVPKMVQSSALDGEYWAVPDGGRQPKAVDRLDTLFLEKIVQKSSRPRLKLPSRTPTAEELAHRRALVATILHPFIEKLISWLC